MTPVLVGHLVSWALEACKVSRETWARQERWVFKVCLVFQAPLDLWVSRAPSVQRDSLVQSVSVANKANLVQQACVAHLVQLVLLAQSVFVARLALPVLRVRWVLLERREIQARRVSKAILAPSGLRVLLVLLVPRELMVRMESRALWDPVAIVAHKVCEVSLVPQVHKVSRARRARKVALDLVASKVFKALRVTLAIGGQWVLVVVVQLGHRDHKEFRGLRASVESLGPGLVGQLVLWARRENVVKWESKVRRETLDRQDPRVSVVAMD